MNETMTAVPEHPLAVRLAGLLTPYRPVLSRWQWYQQDERITTALGFLGGDSLAIVLDPSQGRLVLDVWVGNAPCTVEALLALLAANFNAPWKTRVAEHDAEQAVVCLEALLPLEYGLNHLVTLVQEGLAAGLRRRGALSQLWRKTTEQTAGISA